MLKSTLIVVSLTGLVFSSPVAESKCRESYTVKFDDTAYGIARACGITLADLEKWNPDMYHGSNDKWIWAGDILKIGSSSNNTASPAPSNSTSTTSPSPKSNGDCKNLNASKPIFDTESNSCRSAKSDAECNAIDSSKPMLEAEKCRAPKDQNDCKKLYKIFENNACRDPKDDSECNTADPSKPKYDGTKCRSIVNTDCTDPAKPIFQTGMGCRAPSSNEDCKALDPAKPFFENGCRAIQQKDCTFDKPWLKDGECKACADGEGFDSRGCSKDVQCFQVGANPGRWDNDYDPRGRLQWMCEQKQNEYQAETGKFVIENLSAANCKLVVEFAKKEQSHHGNWWLWNNIQCGNMIVKMV